MITIRNDDVLVPSDKWEPVSRFIQIHELICKAPRHLFHVPAIVVEEIQQFPEVIRYIQGEVKKGTMMPEIHGWDHIDYGTITKGEILSRLSRCVKWFKETLGYTPTRWYTPWHSTSDDMVSAAIHYNLKMVLETPNLRLEGINQIKNNIDCELMIHWWNKRDIDRVERLVHEVSKL